MWRVLTNSSRTAALLSVTLISVALLSSCSIPTGQIEQVSPTNGITVSVQVVTDQGGGVTILAPVMISGQGPFTFVVDTGASVSLIDRPVANRLGLQVSGNAQQVEGIGGVQTVIPVQISSWNLGKINLPATNVDKTSFSDLELGGNAVGLLGSDIWNAFGEVTINYTDQTLTVYKQVSTSSTGTISYPV
jgi:predicted aspartyl protease